MDHSAKELTPVPQVTGQGRTQSAVRYALLVLGSFALLAAVTAGTLWVLDEMNAGHALRVAGRVLLLGLAFAMPSGLGRLICRAPAMRLSILRSAPGDIGTQLGFLAGLVIVGFLSREAVEPITRPGASAVQLAGRTLDGNDFSLDQCRGKVVLVDFWATWCGPCRAELPNVRHIYRKYHDRGFEIVGVSLDEDRRALRDFVKEEGLSWPQLVSEAPGWENPYVRQFKVHAIPYTLLIDREGALAGDELRGSDLEAALAQQFGEPAPFQWRSLISYLLLAFVKAEPVTLVVVSVGTALAGAMLEAVLRKARF
jgi:thiol-disulfide isomerase/thioredoxin